MRLTFLGTSAGTPTRARNVSAIALELPERGVWWLFDCGEGTQQQILRCPHLRLARLTRIFLTHLHGDHLYGLPGLLASRALGGGGGAPPGVLTICGPEGAREFVEISFGVGGGQIGYPLRFETVCEALSPGEPLIRDTNFSVHARPLRHRGPSWGYTIVEDDLPGRFAIEKARALKIPPGPLYGQLKNGENVTLPDGRIIHGGEFTSDSRPGRRVTILGDTGFCENSIRLAENADVLVHEATFAEDEQHLAARSRHATATDAATVARQANARQLILTHISPRYEEENRLENLLAEARAVFPETEIAADFLTVEIIRPDEPFSA